MNSSFRIFLGNVLMATTATAAAAQSGPGGCTPVTAEAVYGISAIECLQCTVHNSAEGRWVEYGAEPVIRGMNRARTGIEAGDVLVAIDGKLITTQAGGQRLSQPDMTHAAVHYRAARRKAGGADGRSQSARCSEIADLFATSMTCGTVWGRGSSGSTVQEDSRYMFDSAGRAYRAWQDAFMNGGRSSRSRSRQVARAFSPQVIDSQEQRRTSRLVDMPRKLASRPHQGGDGTAARHSQHERL